MIKGICALSYGSPARSLTFNRGFFIGNIIGIDPLPGSIRALDRATGKIVDCTIEICSYGDVEKGGRIVNYAPFVGSR